MAKTYLLFSVPHIPGLRRKLAGVLLDYYPVYHDELLVPVGTAPDGDELLLLPSLVWQSIQGRILFPELRTELAQKAPSIVMVAITEEVALEYVAKASERPQVNLPPGEIVNGYSRALRATRVPQAHAMFADGTAVASIRIGHIDTGVNGHPCLRNNPPAVHEGVNYKETATQPLDPWPASYTYPGMPGHGGRTISVLAASDAENLMGVAPWAKVVPYRLSNNTIIDFLGNNTRLAEALLHALQAGCQVVTLSMGDPFKPEPLVAAAVDELYEAGIIFCSAAGNVIDSVVWPARFKRVIAVAGSLVPEDDAPDIHVPWSGSSFGEEADISAPADKVARANWTGVGAASVANYGVGDGTSFATPAVAGTAALWLAKHGAALDAAGLTGWRRVEAFRHVLTRTAVPFKPGSPKGFGAGVLNCQAVLAAPLPTADQLTKRPAAVSGAGT
ncbi:S8 family peptidase [Niveispirillum sp. KHB5.9]|uniref:S8 family peptidase n=1 Tax=Niveispirillum sp. KHB5.9 TaxID=3400269 RepID=UPI003A8C6E13